MTTKTSTPTPTEYTVGSLTFASTRPAEPPTRDVSIEFRREDGRIVVDVDKLEWPGYTYIAYQLQVSRQYAEELYQQLGSALSEGEV